MIYCTVCVGKQWVNKESEYIEEFAKNNELFVLTNCPEKFTNSRTKLYSRKEFSYFEKVNFILDLIKEYKTRITYIDANKISQYRVENKFKEGILYTKSILPWEHLDKYFIAPDTLSYISMVMEMISVKSISFKYPQENILSIPYFDRIDEAILDVKTIQPYLERYYNNVPKTKYLERYSKTGVGYAEGWSIGALAYKYKLPLEEINSKIYTVI